MSTFIHFNLRNSSRRQTPFTFVIVNLFVKRLDSFTCGQFPSSVRIFIPLFARRICQLQAKLAGECQNDTATKWHGESLWHRGSLWHSDKMTRCVTMAQCVTLARRVTLTQRQNDTVRHFGTETKWHGVLFIIYYFIKK